MDAPQIRWPQMQKGRRVPFRFNVPASRVTYTSSSGVTGVTPAGGFATSVALASCSQPALQTSSNPAFLAATVQRIPFSRIQLSPVALLCPWRASELLRLARLPSISCVFVPTALRRTIEGRSFSLRARFLEPLHGGKEFLST